MPNSYQGSLPLGSNFFNLFFKNFILKDFSQCIFGWFLTWPVHKKSKFVPFKYQIHLLFFQKINNYLQLLQKGITNILNITSQEYKKRTKYFKYLNIDVQNKSDEDIKKHFRITNRFLQEVMHFYFFIFYFFQVYRLRRQSIYT
ncbi:hypothetical protein IMG5_028560 [Ichthyophthirius multifiliis]|uniref:Transmembrane protein n=1 Tax=Ichthyophthirius multifiliis TaxID=5932 RepID=G0QLC0_ICHMU|nr:hypothetical protein IMG5_028560 [Ichthyophthirius multifiliis]EGR33986.1 hypothetical protein IMG5_028560 [Ichthyophthirius multifiliis]|eukprot:XP_004039290.1 hypothetical protein IMG5_028560 [Ichthyophthirius multifiliis]